MNEKVMERVAWMRDFMRRSELGAIVVPTMDPHGSEYVACHWQMREWLTGFTGSAGTAVLTSTEALLWTDSRYWLQAEAQLQQTPFRLMREGEDVEVAQWLSETQGRVGFPEDMMTPELFDELFPDSLRERAVALPADFADVCWTERPALPLTAAERMPDNLAGESAQSKLRRVADWMATRGIGEYCVSDLSEIAWLLNLRAADIPYTPFLISFLLLRTDGHHTLCVHRQQVSPEVETYLAALGVRLDAYERGLQIQRQRLGHSFPPLPIAEMRAIKNPVEQEGFRTAHLRDGVAMVRFLRRLDEHFGEWTELSASDQLETLRRQQPGFCGLSFATIAASGEHAAIVHYEPTADTDIPLRDGLFLLDSGAHYDCGTTDVTRTIALGTVSDEQKKAYTLVLRGHLQLQNLRFPVGTTGLQLDTAARAPLWRAGFDFGHGTGHGVGHRLSVHEGPLQIRKNLRPCTTLPMQVGQVITDEPGIYAAGRYGVRIENTLLCVPAEETPFGRFLCFEPLTLCPYDMRAVVPDMLTAEERQWLNQYHRCVREKLLPHLTDEADRRWLCSATEEF